MLLYNVVYSGFNSGFKLVWSKLVWSKFNTIFPFPYLGDDIYRGESLEVLLPI